MNPSRPPLNSWFQLGHSKQEINAAGSPPRMGALFYRAAKKILRFFWGVLPTVPGKSAALGWAHKRVRENSVAFSPTVALES